MRCFYSFLAFCLVIAPLRAESEFRFPRDYAPGTQFSVISDPKLLQHLEEAIDLSLPRHFEDAEELPASNEQLYKASPAYRSLADSLSLDINSVLKEEKKISKKAGIGLNNYHRLFNPQWLKSKTARYELVGIVNRLDRVAFSRKPLDNESNSLLVPNPDKTCGELRFIYRLAYELPSYQGVQRKNPADPQDKTLIQTEVNLGSRLPMTVNVVYWVKNLDGTWNSCKRFARSWVYPERSDPKALAQWMASKDGPVSASVFSRDALKSVEINLQALRVPSSMRPHMGGNAEYLLRAYRKKGGTFALRPLEGTPDVAALQKDASLKNELLAFLKDPKNFSRLDAGILLLPDKFLAKRASSFSPYASARLINRPFDQIFEEKDFADLDYNNRRYVKSAGAALKRLNDMSCVGCHQGSATAGFHFLGIDDPDTHYANALVFEGSGHFALELQRRKKYLERVSANRVPVPHRPFSVAPSENEPGWADFNEALVGQSCGLKGGAFEDWKCDSSARCLALDSAEGEKDWGRCVPSRTQSGDPCLMGSVRQTASPNKDKITSPKEISCNQGARGYTCLAYRSGFPGGMCSADKENMVGDREILGHFAGNGFSSCLAGQKFSFEECLIKTIDFKVRGSCDTQRPCRPDYVCVKTPYSEDPDLGTCTPTYFAFQLRLDGHPTPQGGSLKDLNGKEP